MRNCIKSHDIRKAENHCSNEFWCLRDGPLGDVCQTCIFLYATE